MNISFSQPPSDLELLTNEIHVWCASLGQRAFQFQSLKQALSEDEQIRAERFHFEQDRKHFIAGRWILRKLLGRYLNIDPCQVKFRYGKNGKPMLFNSFGKGTLFFNRSDSEGVSVFAFARDNEVGVDIEHIRPIAEIDQIARQFFTEREQTILWALPENKKKKAFFNCWTRKEAFLKAKGVGLMPGLNQCEVSLSPGRPAIIISTPIDPRDAGCWSLEDLEVENGTAAAIAYQGPDRQLKRWRWEE